MELKLLDAEFTVCKITDTSTADFSGDFVFLSKTDDEVSLVCDTASIPDEATDREDGFSALKICGTLDFSLVGIIARISGILAEAGISVFVVSTFNTDYVLIKSEHIKRAAELLSSGGYTIL